MAGVVLNTLRKTFRGPRKEEICAVKDLSLEIGAGELMVLVGPSGCGKTTTLRLIAGLEEPDAGSISLAGRSLNGIEPREREVAMVFQNHALYPHMTVRENLASGLVWRKFPKAEVETRVMEAARMLELADCLERLPETISGGQRQRVAVGRALVLKPRLFLFDEPLSNLDAPMRLQMRREIVRLNRTLRTTMIYVTHDQSEAMAMGDRIAVMRDGCLQQVAAPAELYQRPANQFVAAFFGLPPMNFIAGTIESANGALRFRTVDGALNLALPAPSAARLGKYAGQPVLLGLRPEMIAERNGAVESGGCADALVELVEPQGAEALVQLKAGTAAFCARFPRADRSLIGQTVAVKLDLAAAHFFDPDSAEVI